MLTAPISTPSITRALFAMLTTLNGTALTPRHRNDAHWAVASTHCPAQLEVPAGQPGTPLWL